MEDVRKRRDERNLAIDRVGISDLRYPIVVTDRAQARQQTIANLTMSVDLPHHVKGTHMSRFLEVLNVHREDVTMRTLPLLLSDLKYRLDAERARIEVRFPYFLERRAPVTGAVGLMDYQCCFTGELNGAGGDFVLGVTIPVTSLCPCSKEISDYGAHNQRGYVSVDVRTDRNQDGSPRFLWIEDLVELAERSASSPLFPLLKRPDERYVTMDAYDNPVFVEDLVRNVACCLRDDNRVSWFRVHVVNQESIHNHNAFAYIDWTRPDPCAMERVYARHLA